MRRVLLVTCALGLAIPSTAAAAGGPVPPVQGGAGVSVPGDPAAYVAVGAGGRTVVERLEGNQVVRSRVVPGSYGVPGAAYDGSTTGLSGDGRTLVLAAWQSGANRTRLLPLRARTLRPLAPVTLRGAYVVDALSPDGRTLYLVGYPSGALKYDVRAYDLVARRMLPGTIVDPRDPKDKLQGLPMTRTTSPDGRWVYTLYTGGEENFVHALDTVNRTAACIDLDGPTTEDLSSAKLVLDGGTLRIGTLATVDTRTFAVTAPPAVRRSAALKPTATPAARAHEDGGGGVPWVPAVLGVFVLGGVALLVLARRRPAVPELSVQHRVDGHPSGERQATL